VPKSLLVGVLILGAFLRFHALDRQSLWDDEMSTIRTISTPVRDVLQRFATYETHPPLYFLQLKVWRALHLRSLVKLRSNSAFWGVLSLFLVYVAGRRYGGEGMGLLAAAFLALSPFHLAYSQEMRPYAMAMAISLAALLALERRSWIALGALWTALLYTHYWGAFVVLAQAAYGYYESDMKRDRQTVLRTAGSAALLFAPWLMVLGPQLGVVDRLVFWVSPFSLANLGKVFLAYGGMLFNMASWTFYLPARVWVFVVLGLAFLMALLQGVIHGPRAAVLWLAVGLGIPWLLSIWKPAIFVWYRYPVLMLPAFALLVAFGFLTLRPLALRLTLVLLCLGSQVWGDWVYFHQWQKANPKAVVQYVHWLRRPDTVVVRPSYFGDLFNFYDQGTTSVVDEDLLDSSEKRAALNGRNVILLVFDVPSDPVADALLSEFKPASARYFPGTAHLGITVYELR
jgi:mannosyltransferase